MKNEIFKSGTSLYPSLEYREFFLGSDAVTSPIKKL